MDPMGVQVEVFLVETYLPIPSMGLVTFAYILP